MTARKNIFKLRKMLIEMLVNVRRSGFLIALKYQLNDAHPKYIKIFFLEVFPNSKDFFSKIFLQYPLKLQP